jgi:tetratricopeptide (TPR) repeat protein
VTHLSDDDLDDLEFDTLRTGDHSGAAVRLSKMADAVSGGVSRAKILLRAGEQWQYAGDHERAAAVYRQAIEDGGEAYGDPRAYLADALFELGQHDEAKALIKQIYRDRPRDPEVYRCVAELLYAYGDLDQAHEWATTGADVVLGTEGEDAKVASDSLEALLRLRYRARVDLGRDEDRYDAMLDDLLKETPPRGRG